MAQKPPRAGADATDAAELKSREAFRSISEVAKILQVPQHVLRFWESKFTQLKPLKRRGGRRYYRLSDIELLCGVHRLLYIDRYTIEGVRKVFSQHGTSFVTEIGRNALSFSSGGEFVGAQSEKDGAVSLLPQVTREWKQSSLPAVTLPEEAEDDCSEVNEKARERVLRALDELEKIGTAMKSEFEIESGEAVAQEASPLRCKEE